MSTRSNTVKSALSVIERTASECGLCPDDIDALVTVATSNKLREFVKTQFFSCHSGLVS